MDRRGFVKLGLAAGGAAGLPRTQAAVPSVLDAGGQDLSSGYAYWLVLGDAPPRADVRDVVEWIKAEAALVALEPPAAAVVALALFEPLSSPPQAAISMAAPTSCATAST